MNGFNDFYKTDRECSLSPTDQGGAVAQRVGRAFDLRLAGRGFRSYSGQRCVTTLGKLFTPLSPSSITWYRPWGDDALWLGR